ncbi:Notchless protein homolog 1 [Bos taurus] [Rhizoctonia solani]|uniref:Notchless protein homolog 1 [Bos taurus] n=1 Tax=Rhizoctonia solani TaxID=456999 RepID=A0A0K6G7V7_9AGAM|nr:Notchless protein homolog 1 [Bos taurus] [Rhizoctonia solani]
MGVSTLAIVEKKAMVYSVILMGMLLTRATQDDELEKLVPSSSARYSSGAALKLKRGPCTQGTRMNVLDEMYQWASKPDAGNVYWMSGMAGTGKTTIAYSLCERLDAESNRMLGASFFCSRLLPECRSVGNIIPSIAYQLAHRSRAFRHALYEAIKKTPEALDGAPSLQFDLLLTEPLSDPELKRTFSTSMVVVIDALDECEDETSTRQILEVLLTKSEGLPIKFVVSSRPEATIRDQMAKNDQGVVLHELDKQEVQIDIKAYLREGLAPMNPSDSEIEKLVERAGVLFIYAATVIRYVGYDEFGRNPRARLKSVLGLAEKRGTGQTKEIDQLYGAILEAAMNDDELEQPDRDDMKLILNTVVCARAPLTIDALNALLKLGDIERVNAALRPLWSVLHVKGPGIPITTLHASFPDYLTDPQRSGNSEWYCNAAIHHCILAQRSLECIRDTRPQFNICNLESSYLDDNEVPDLDMRVERCVSIQLRYACQYWSTHLDLGGSETGAAQALLILLGQFLANHLFLWLEVMNLTKNNSSTPGNLTLAKRWLTKHSANRELVDMMQDAVRFALTIVSSPVSGSTPHIYVSIFPFLPPNSPIRKHYASRIRGTIQVNGTALDQRKPLLAQWPTGTNGVGACSPDGTLISIASGFPDVRISLIDTSSGRLVQDFPYDNFECIWCVAFAPDGAGVASGTDDKEIWVWDIGSGQLVLGPLQGHEGPVFSIIFSHDGSYIISGSSDKTIHIWDAHSGKPLFTPLVGHTGTITSLAISSDDTKIISGSEDATICVWDVQNGCLALDPITGHIGSVVSVALSPDDKFIASCSIDSTMVWDSQTGECFLGRFPSKCSVAFSPDGAYISAGSEDGSIEIWDASTGRTVSGLIKEHYAPVTVLAYSSDGTRIISYSDEDGTLSLFDAYSITTPINPISGHTKPVFSIDVSPDGKHVVSGSGDMTVCVWNPLKGQVVLGPLTGHVDHVNFVRYSADGSRFLSCAKDATLRQWDAQTGECIQTDQIIRAADPSAKYRAWFFVAAYSPDGTSIATISVDGWVCVWSSNSGELVLRQFEETRMGRSVGFSSDGATLITGWDDGTIQTWDIQNSQLTSEADPQGVSPPLSAFTFSLDWSSLIVAPSGAQAEKPPVFYQMDSRTRALTPSSFKGHTARITFVDFSRESTHVVSGSEDQTVHVWNTKAGTSIFGPLRGHQNSVTSLAFSPDSTYVASGSHDTDIRIWDIRQYNSSDEFSADSGVTEWVLDNNGWVVDGQQRRLIWVPPNLRASLLWPRNVALLSRNGYMRLNFEGSFFGEVWANCWITR